MSQHASIAPTRRRFLTASPPRRSPACRVRTKDRRSSILLLPGLPTDRSLHAAHRRRNELHGSARRPVLSGLRGRESGTALARVHGVGLDPASIERLGSLDVTLVWSPRSNLVLYTRRWTCSTRCGPAPGLVWRRSWVTRCPARRKRPNFLMSRCNISPGNWCLAPSVSSVGTEWTTYRKITATCPRARG